MPAGVDITGLLILLAGGVALVAFWRRGCLASDALLAGPTRDTGLTAADLVMGLTLWLAGQLAVPTLLLPALGVEFGPDLAEQLPITYAQFVLLAQLAAYTPPTLYLLLRASFHAGGIDGLRQLGLGTAHARDALRLTALAILGGLPLVMAVLSLTRLVSIWLGAPAPPVAHDLLQYIATVDTLAELLTLILAAVIVAAVVEEIFFRGLLQGALVAMLGPRWRWTAVLVVAAGFAAIHLGGVTWHALPGLMTLGVIMGWLYERSGSLWPAIALHAAFNALNIALVRAGAVG